MNSICGSPLWDSDITWNTNTPEFTPCFEKTILIWIPSAFLLLFSTLQIFLAMKSNRARIPMTTLGLIQEGLTAGLIIVAIVDFSFTFRRIDAPTIKLYPIDQAEPLIKAATYAVALFLQILTKRRGIRSSAILFIFWLLTAICSFFEFQRLIKDLPLKDKYINQKIHTVLILTSYALVLAEFLSNFFADLGSTPGVHSDKPDEKRKTRPCPRDSASIPNRYTFQWMYPLLWKGHKKALEFSDLWDLDDNYKTTSVTKTFRSYWDPEYDKVRRGECCKNSYRNTNKLPKDQENKGGDTNEKAETKIASVLPALWRSNWHDIIASAILKLIQDVLVFVSPLLLGLLIDHLRSNSTEESWKGYLFLVVLFTTVTGQTICNNNQSHLLYLTGMRIRSALTFAVYKKSFVLSNATRKDSTTGEIVNLMSIDAQRFQEATQFIHHLWSAPLQISIAVYFLWGYLGVSTLSGLFVLLLFVPLNGKLTVLIKISKAEQMKKKDERIRLINEVLTGIKVLKLYAWEPSYEDRIKGVRDMELRIIKRLAHLNALSFLLWNIAPVMVSIAAFATYVLISESNTLDTETAFVSLTLFNIMRMPMGMLPLTIAKIAEIQVSLKRMNKFLNAEELDSAAVSHDQQENGDVVSVQDGNFTWDESLSSPTLRNINLGMKKGSLIALVGTVGSGKSSLLSAILGEMEKVSGRVNIFGRVAYVAQQAWIQNATLQDNILFGNKLNECLYTKIIKACALKPDLRILPGGDKTEIGEKGINLSGGQKQRIALARAVYDQADIYLLDDPLSAVDSQVGKQLFEEVVGPNGLLRERTRIFVTHGITYLPHVDRIIVMNHGEITESGTYTELIANNNDFAEFLTQHSNGENNGINSAEGEAHAHKGDTRARKTSVSAKDEEMGKSSSIARVDSESSIVSWMSSTESGILMKIDDILENDVVPAGNQTQLIGVEKVEVGTVKMDVYTYLIKTMGFLLIFASLTLFTVGQGLNIYSGFWLSEWSRVPAINGTQDIKKRNIYLIGYSALGTGNGLVTYLANVTLLLGCLKAAGTFHESMLSRILRSPMSFFDSTPVGRIVNRFSKDVDVPDSLFSSMFYMWSSNLYRVMGVMVVISINTPIFLAVFVPIAIVYLFIQRFYVATSRQLKRLESVSRSPLFCHFTETLTGLPTIRAFKCESQFLKELEQNLDKNQEAYFPFICTNRWLTFLLECVGNLVVLFATLFALVYQKDEGSVGLSITYALNITHSLNLLVRNALDIETNMVSVERIKEYNEISQEAAWYVEMEKPSADWPQAGCITFCEFQTRYREDLDLVLRRFTCKIRPREKIGIVGRTGAGKSSLTLGLFRILEAAGGSILIDGKDISKMGLQDLRERLTIIPQEPVLFVGTLRLNLDPFGKYSDDEIWRSVELAHLKEIVSHLPGGLHAKVEENGDNFSVGQRQLLCLARALLRKTKILILDEATAAVDLETDDLIQKTIRTEFKECTVLTIAHRLNTILDSDRVMVVDKGKIREFDCPQILLSNPGSIFSNMARAAGLL